MKRKINMQFVILTTVAILVTMLLSTLINYAILKREVMDDLHVYATALKGTGFFEKSDFADYKETSKDLRITLIDTDGTVLYDTKVKALEMGNHSNREEIAEAAKKGEGKAVRHSETIGVNTIYYAVLLENGNILRVAKDTHSVIGILMSTLPYLFIIIAFLLLLSVVFTHMLTRSIVKPIDEMAQNMNHYDLESVYKELRPFVSKIQKQHADILQTAQIRQEFTANVSHELKTPLTAISGYAELIEHGMAGEEDIERFSREIHQNANRLLSLINDIIRLSELDSSELELTIGEIDLYQMAAKCIGLLQVSAQRHQVHLELQGESCKLLSNEQMIEELMYNLCDNAIRYNIKNGSVWLMVGKDERGDTYLEVRDTGIGIPKEFQERIFERFYRVDKSRSKSTGGTGLGLAIVKHIVVQLHGLLTLNSTPGKGTRIRITFPEAQ